MLDVHMEYLDLLIHDLLCVLNRVLGLSLLLLELSQERLLLLLECLELIGHIVMPWAVHASGAQPISFAGVARLPRRDASR